MTRIPALDRDKMDDKQAATHDQILADGGRIGFGPAIGYAYSGPVWDSHNKSGAHLLDCSLANVKVRIISLMTVRHWKAAYMKTPGKDGGDPRSWPRYRGGHQRRGDAAGFR